MTTQHQGCSDDLPADMRALARACSTAARLPPNERGRVIREAGDESARQGGEDDQQGGYRARVGADR